MGVIESVRGVLWARRNQSDRVAYVLGTSHERFGASDLLRQAVLAEEAKRQDEQSSRSAETVLPDDLLPGVGDEQLKLRKTFRQGGQATMVVIVLTVIFEHCSRVATSVLGPDIQDTLNTSDTTLIGIAVFGGVALVLGAVPMAWLADRMPRKQLVMLSGFGGAGALVLARVDEHSGLVKIGGEEWTARAYDATQVLEPGQKVQVVDIKGATALVWRLP